MAKVQIKSEKITPFGEIFHVREQFSRFVGPFIDKVLGLRWQGTHLRLHEQRIRVGNALSIEHLHTQQIISEPFRAH